MRAWGIALVVVAAGCAAASSPPVFSGGIEERLVDDDSNSVIVPVRINGRVRHFILDSGASISAVTPATASSLGLVSFGTTIVNDVETPVARLDSLAVGEALHHDVRVAVVDLPAAKRMHIEYDGVLGLDVLGRYDVVIDFSQNRLSLLPIGTVSRSQAAREMARVSFRPSKHGLMLMTADVEFVPIPAVLDLGAQYSLVNRAASVMGRTFDARTRPSHVHVGDEDLGQWRMLIGDLPIFARSGLVPGPAIVLGADVFAHRTVVLAYHERAVYVSRER